MTDLQGRKVFKVFNQDFIVDERYNVTKELGQGAYGIVWSVGRLLGSFHASSIVPPMLLGSTALEAYASSRLTRWITVQQPTTRQEKG